MTYVWEIGPDDPTECFVLLALANEANDAGLSCFPSIARLAKHTRRSERTVMRAIQILESGQNPWIEVVRDDPEHEDSPGRGTSYILNVSRMETLYSVELAKRRLERRPRKREKASTRDMVSRVEVPTGDTVSRDMVSGDTASGDTVTDTGDIDDIPPHPLLGRPVITRNTPLPPQAGERGGEIVKPPHDYTQDAIDFFATRTGVTNPRVLKALHDPLRFWMREHDSTAYDAAVEMADRWTRYLNDPNRIGKPQPMTTFFTHGYWLNPGSWSVLTVESTRRVN
jgi:Helix-turn-helix domain